jgi:TrpR-related protein YerC/YecD
MGGRVKYQNLTELEKKVFLGEFYDMIALLKSREEVKQFFKDLLTLSEVVMISRRLQIAKMLLEGFTYREVQKKLKVGVPTIVYVERWLNQGFGGYRNIITRHKKQKESKFKNYEPAPPFSLNHLRKKYPLHFLLWNMVKKNK